MKSVRHSKKICVHAAVKYTIDFLISLLSTAAELLMILIQTVHNLNGQQTLDDDEDDDDEEGNENEGTCVYYIEIRRGHTMNLAEGQEEEK